MMIVSETQTALPVVRRDASSITTEQGFSAFMVTERPSVSEEVNPVGPQEPQSVPPEGAESSTTGSFTDPTAPPTPHSGTAEGRIGQGAEGADQDTETDHIAFVGRGAMRPTKPLTADQDVLPTAPHAGLAGDLHGPRLSALPDGQAATPSDAKIPTDPTHTAPYRVSDRGVLTTERLQDRATNLHGHHGTGSDRVDPVQVAAPKPGSLVAPQRLLAAAVAPEPQGATEKTRSADIVPPDEGPRLAARAAPAPSAIEAAFSFPVRFEQADGAITPSDARDKSSKTAAPVTGTVTPSAAPFGTFVNPAGNRTAEPAADLMPFAEPEPDGTLRLAATETTSSALRGTTSAFTHFAPPQNASQTTTQIVAAISRASVDGQKTTEVALNPAELGRVRLHLATTDGVLIVMVSAERTETMELLRRNIETLTNDLKETGYDGAQIVFSQDGGGARDREARAPVTAPTLETPAANTPDMPPPMLVMLGDRLDIRV